jgi:hypothetical protein
LTVIDFKLGKIMRTFGLVGACVTSLIFVAPAQAVTPKSGASCAMVATTPWAIPASRVNPATRLTITGRSTGPSCAHAGLSYTITNARGRVIFQQRYQADSVAPFLEVRNRVQMQAALIEWIKPTNQVNFLANLPNWPAGADAPVQEEFGFTPAETMTREEYRGIIASRTPTRCYVQGIESINCVIYHDGVIDPFGVQQFPG